MENCSWSREELKKALTDTGTGVDEIFGPKGESILLTPRGARILGMFSCPEGDSPNPFWIHPNVTGILSGELVDWEGDGTGSVGGDRLWVSPEQSFYYRTPESFEDWFCPAEMDPGNYQRIMPPSGWVTYRNDVNLMDRLLGQVYPNIQMNRSFAWLGTPGVSGSLPENTSYLGVRTVEALFVPAGDFELALQPWVLTQIPAGSEQSPGTVVIPVKENAEPVGYFAPLPSDRLKKSEDHVSFRIDAECIGKLGIRPEDLPEGRPAEIAYFLVPPSSSKAVLTVRRTYHAPMNQSDCLDVAKADTSLPRASIQSYNHGPGDGGPYPRFGEIEIQLTPLRRGGSGWYSRAETELRVFVGPKETLPELLRALLALRDTPFLF